ncbi:hypothetical protein NA57DRAFT_59298 [Rhizodiscina lignyota]|uniref:Uncharacterized protein n=1 Tax=Rhizodiscina lignyota TaxID=1504668 RepID=A0A9P4ICX5_9PEZI|nr:hypothetical protein NA57DRAFT_59298 [Rhizodiscina lignyota]
MEPQQATTPSTIPLSGTSLPELPPIPLSAIIFIAIAATIGALTTALLYFAVFPPSNRSLAYVPRFVGRLTKLLSRKRKVKYERLPADEVHGSGGMDLEVWHDNVTMLGVNTEQHPNTSLRSRSPYSDYSQDAEDDRNSEFEWLLRRGQFDEESLMPLPQRWRLSRERSRSSPPRPRSAGIVVADTARAIASPIISGWQSLPGTPDMGERIRSTRAKQNANKEAKVRKLDETLWERINSAMEWMAEKLVEYALDDGGSEDGLLLPISNIERASAPATISML